MIKIKSQPGMYSVNVTYTVTRGGVTLFWGWVHPDGVIVPGSFKNETTGEWDRRGLMPSASVCKRILAAAAKLDDNETVYIR